MLLADENIPAGTVAALRTQGWDVTSVREIGPGMTDDAVLALAVSQGRILISFDRDHGELVFWRGRPAPPAIIYLRLLPVSATDLSGRLSWLLNGGAGPIEGFLVVVEEDGIRKRRLPSK